MIVQWLGTAAAEGWPALFCQCEACREAQRRGGRDIRSRHGGLIDGRLLIDLNPDLLYQKQRFQLDLGAVEDIIITHFHSDHLTPATLGLMFPVMAHRGDRPPLRIHGSARVLSMLDEHGGRVQLAETRDGKSFEAGGCRVTPLPAVHGGEDSQAQIYLIEKGGAALLWAHDTDLFCEAAWRILEERVTRPLSAASLDCTNGPLPHGNYFGHMGFDEDVELKRLLREKGMADEKTLFVCNHFSHNGHVLYREAARRMAKHGFLIAYDGMTKELAEGR